MDTYFETPSILTPVPTNFAVAACAANHAYILYYHDMNINTMLLLSRYSEIYIDISVYWYIAHIPRFHVVFRSSTSTFFHEG